MQGVEPKTPSWKDAMQLDRTDGEPTGRCSMATFHPSWRYVMAAGCLLAVVAAALLGCRGTPNPSGAAVRATSAPCPPSIPAAGMPCPAPDPYVHFCEYGGDSNTDCTTLVD